MPAVSGLSQAMHLDAGPKTSPRASCRTRRVQSHMAVLSYEIKELIHMSWRSAHGARKAWGINASTGSPFMRPLPPLIVCRLFLARFEPYLSFDLELEICGAVRGSGHSSPWRL